MFVQKPEEIIPESLPVLVYIHGGGFDHGSGNPENIRPDNMVRQNLVFVTVGYRLGVFGGCKTRFYENPKFICHKTNSSV